MKRVLRAALKLSNGAIIALGNTDRHNDLIRFHHNSELSVFPVTGQGFIIENRMSEINSGYLSYACRQEAYNIAQAAGQLKEKTGRKDVLYTEDLF